MEPTACLPVYQLCHYFTLQTPSHPAHLSYPPLQPVNHLACAPSLLGPCCLTPPRPRQLHELYEAIKLGANSFLTAEYKMCLGFVVVTAPLIAFLIARGSVTRRPTGPERSRPAERRQPSFHLRLPPLAAAALAERYLLGGRVHCRGSHVDALGLDWHVRRHTSLSRAPLLLCVTWCEREASK